MARLSSPGKRWKIDYQYIVSVVFTVHFCVVEQAYQQIMNIVRISKLRMPLELIEQMRPFKDNDEAVRRFGIVHCTEMCRKILDSGLVHGLHFYTLNRDVATVEILRNLGMYTEYPRRSLPWKTSANHLRCREDVRPIFWSTRPQSYIYRTSDWDEFPNGRWGNSASASFSVIDNYYLFYLKSRAPKSDLLKMWGEELTSEKDVWSVFLYYLTGDLNKAGIRVSTFLLLVHRIYSSSGNTCHCCTLAHANNNVWLLWFFY